MSKTPCFAITCWTVAISSAQYCDQLTRERILPTAAASFSEPAAWRASWVSLRPAPRALTGLTKNSSPVQRTKHAPRQKANSYQFNGHLFKRKNLVPLEMVFVTKKRSPAMIASLVQSHQLDVPTSVEDCSVYPS